MTSNIKFYQEVIRVDGSKNHFIGVPKYITKKTGDRAGSFDTIEDARAYSTEVQARVARYNINLRSSGRLNTTSAPITVSHLVDFYRSTEEYTNLKPRSIVSYELMLKTSLNAILPGSNMILGDMEVGSLTKDTVRIFKKHIKDTFSHHRQLHSVKVMRLVWTVGEGFDKVIGNPWRNPKIKLRPKRMVVWTPSQVDRFIAKAEQSNLPSMGTFVLMCFAMCQRPGDIRQLQWKHLSPPTNKHERGIFEFTQEKTFTEVYIPLSPALQERLDNFTSQIPHWREDNPDEYILRYEVTGKPYTQWDYAKILRKICRAAGLPDHLRMGDLRRTGTTNLANFGCTEDQLMSITGHKNREEISTYIKRSADLAKNAITQAYGV
tara:strand:- start:672 stop:1805 length:1134 start_codon:yes stop_codon:yes gene_type:complete